MRFICNLYWFVRGTVISVTLLLCATGCSSPDITNDISEYQQRLSRVLDADLAVADGQATVTEKLAYPARDALLKHPTPIDINLTRFHQLQQCELGNLVAEHNTALGKIQHFSQRLRYEQLFLAALDDCINFVRSPSAKTGKLDDMAAAMTQWQIIKQREYRLHWSNMLVLSDETKAAFSRSRPGLLSHNNIDIAGQVSLFQQLSRFADHRYQPRQSLENSLQAISATRLPATMWQAQQLIATQLLPLTAALEKHLNNIDCSATTPEQANILRNVFYLFFIEKIQPAGARINAFNYQFAPIMDAWLVSPVLPDSFKRYLRSQQQHFTDYQHAMTQHVTLWQEFLKRCQLSPTAPKK